MKPSELDILRAEGEGTMLEYKEALSASFARELVALANTAGGKILLGVSDDGSVTIYDWDSGAELQTLAPGEGSFIRGVLRSLVRERRSRAAGGPHRGTQPDTGGCGFP